MGLQSEYSGPDPLKEMIEEIETDPWGKDIEPPEHQSLLIGLKAKMGNLGLRIQYALRTGLFKDDDISP